MDTSTSLTGVGGRGNSGRKVWPGRGGSRVHSGESDARTEPWPEGRTDHLNSGQRTSEVDGRKGTFCYVRDDPWGEAKGPVSSPRDEVFDVLSSASGDPESRFHVCGLGKGTRVA